MSLSIEGETSRPLPSSLIERSLWLTYTRCCLTYAPREFLGTRSTNGSGRETRPTYVYGTYHSFLEGVLCLAHGLKSLLHPPNVDAVDSADLSNSVGLCGENSVAWLTADVACVALGCPSIPLHLRLDLAAFTKAASISHMKCLIIDWDCVERYTPAFSNCPALESLVIVGDVSEATVRKELRSTVKTVTTFSRLLMDGASACYDYLAIPLSERLPPRPAGCVHCFSVGQLESLARRCPGVVCQPSAVVTVMFSSGTTGCPKGMPVTQREALADFTDVASSWMLEEEGQTDPIVQLAIYNFAYGMERDNFQTLLLFGGKLALMPSSVPFTSSIDELIAVRPTAILGVPALWILLLGYVGGDVSEARRLFGSRLSTISSGTAPLPAHVERFLRNAFGDRFIGSGYGTSETGLIALDHRIVPGVEVKLRDVAELGFLSTNSPPRGEILVRTNEMATYLSDPERVARSFTDDGYYCTGDIGELPEEGKLLVIDRLGDVFKSLNGEFVSPASLEGMFVSESTLVSDMYVHGSSSMLGLAAVVKLSRPDAEVGIETVLRELNRIADSHKCRSHERIRALIIEKGLCWTPASGLVTPSLKHKRNQFDVIYRGRLEEAFARQTEALTPHDLISGCLGVQTPGDDTLAQLGLDSLTAVRLAFLLRENFGAPADVLSLLLHPDATALTVSAEIRLCTRSADCGERSSGEPGATEVTADTNLAEQDLQLPVTRFDSSSRGAKRHVGGEPCPQLFFVTGGTGCVGSSIVLALLHRFPTCRVVCLVRARERTRKSGLCENASSARARLFSVLKTEDPLAFARSKGRVSVVLGDLEQPLFGWSHSKFVSFARTVTLCVACGAIVDWLRPYAALRVANVVGVATCLSLGVPLLYISSGAVARYSVNSRENPASVSFCPSALAPAQLSGYALTKTVAEYLVHRVSRDQTTGHPTFGIVRLGTVVKRTASTDFVSRFLSTVSQWGVAPNSHEPFEMIPSSYAGESCAALAEELLRLSHLPRASRPQVWTISNPRSLALADVARACGARTFLSPRDFVAWVCKRTFVPLFPLVDILADWWGDAVDDPLEGDIDGDEGVFVCAVTTKTLGTLGVNACPKITPRVCRELLESAGAGERHKACTKV